MRIAIVGANGQLGKDLQPRLTGTVLAWGREQLDLTQPDCIQTRLEAEYPDVVINCAAYNLVDIAETETDKAFANNALGVRNLAMACAVRKIKLVHISTDFVFGQNAERKTPYDVHDCPGPVSVYGVSKLAGEHFALMASPANLVVRTCGLYGRHGSGGKGGNFVETMLKLAGMGKAIKVVNDQTCTPSATVDVADTIANLVKAKATGIVHATNSGQCTWFEFAKTIFELAKVEANLSPTTAKEFGARAARPDYSVLSTNSLNNWHIDPLPDWKNALNRYLSGRK